MSVSRHHFIKGVIAGAVASNYDEPDYDPYPASSRINVEAGDLPAHSPYSVDDTQTETTGCFASGSRRDET
jgi:hypothetical protein